MNSLSRLIISRYNALNLQSVAGIIRRSQIDEGTTPPYTEFTILNDAHKTQSVASRYGDRHVQLKVYGQNDDTLETVADQVMKGFVHADRALTSPMVANPSDGKILTVNPVQDPVVIQEADQIWSATMVVSVQYAQDGGLTPP